MEAQEYNGWTNRETWATMLHIDNDQGLQEIAMDYAKTAREEHREDDSENPEANISLAVYCLEETLKNWIEGEVLDFENVNQNYAAFTMLTDIGSLYRVNYREIADSLMSYVLEEEKVSA